MVKKTARAAELNLNELYGSKINFADWQSVRHNENYLLRQQTCSKEVTAVTVKFLANNFENMHLR